MEVHVAVDSHQQLQQQLLKARGYYHLRWLWCQLQLLWPCLKALLAYDILRDWCRIPGEAYVVLKSRTKQAEMFRCFKACDAHRLTPYPYETMCIQQPTTDVACGPMLLVCVACAWFLPDLQVCYLLILCSEAIDEAVSKL